MLVVHTSKARDKATASSYAQSLAKAGSISFCYKESHPRTESAVDGCFAQVIWPDDACAEDVPAIVGHLVSLPNVDLGRIGLLSIGIERGGYAVRVSKADARIRAIVEIRLSHVERSLPRPRGPVDEPMGTHEAFDSYFFGRRLWIKYDDPEQYASVLVAATQRVPTLGLNLLKSATALTEEPCQDMGIPLSQCQPSDEIVLLSIGLFGGGNSCFGERRWCSRWRTSNQRLWPS